MHHGTTSRVCVPCRYVTRSGSDCPLCHTPFVRMSPKWRAPKKNNDAAWRQIEAGDWLWELDPKREEWADKDFEVHRDNPKFGKTALFPTLRAKYRNSRIRFNQRYGHDYGR